MHSYDIIKSQGEINMINTSSNKHSLKEAMFALKLIKQTMNDVNELNNPHTDTIKTLICIHIDDAIAHLEQLKKDLQK